MPSTSLKILAAILLSLALSGPLRAVDVPPAFTLDLSAPAGEALPSWLGQPETPATTFATLNLPVQPPDATSSLLVTLFFQEKEGGFLRLTWNGTQGAELLTNNFYEGIGMSNQRSLLIAPETLLGGGTLSLQCGDTALGIERIKLQWLETRDGLVAPDLTDPLVTPALGATVPASKLDGLPPLADTPAWQDQIVHVPLTNTPQRIEDGVEFSAQLDSVPTASRLSFLENGLSWNQHLMVWINGQRAGTVTPSVPDLGDNGFIGDPTTAGVYVGWRNGSIYLPGALLKKGVNTVQLSVENETTTPGTKLEDTTSETPPLAVKEVVLQFSCAALTPAPAAPVSTDAASVPSATVTPSAPSDSTSPTDLPPPTLPTDSASPPLPTLSLRTDTP